MFFTYCAGNRSELVVSNCYIFLTMQISVVGFIFNPIRLGYKYFWPRLFLWNYLQDARSDFIFQKISYQKTSFLTWADLIYNIIYHYTVSDNNDSKSAMHQTTLKSLITFLFSIHIYLVTNLNLNQRCLIQHKIRVLLDSSDTGLTLYLTTLIQSQRCIR